MSGPSCFVQDDTLWWTHECADGTEMTGPVPAPVGGERRWVTADDPRSGGTVLVIEQPVVCDVAGCVVAGEWRGEWIPA